jgi:hypothetical protein
VTNRARTPADDGPGWDSLRWLRRGMYVAEVTLTCSADRHVLGHLKRDGADIEPHPEGPVHVQGVDGPTGIWSDGRGLGLAFFAGMLHLSEDGQHARFWEARCAQCGTGSPAPRVSWAQLRRLAHHAAEHDKQLRVALPAGGLPHC